MHSVFQKHVRFARRQSCRFVFALFVVGTMLAAPGAALGLSLQRPMLEELNEHRSELEGAQQILCISQQLRRKVGKLFFPARNEAVLYHGANSTTHSGPVADTQILSRVESRSCPLRC
jgi:hypothetical protein